MIGTVFIAAGSAFVIQRMLNTESLFGMLSLLFSLLFLFYLFRRIQYWNLIESYYEGPSLPIDCSRGFIGLIGSIIFGNLWEALTGEHIPNTDRPDILGMFERNSTASSKKGQKCYRFWAFHPLFFLGRAVLVIHDPELVLDLLSRSSYGKWKKGSSYEISSPLIGTEALLSDQDGMHWKHQRKILNSGFHLDLLKRAHGISKKCVKKLAERWDSVADNDEGTIEIVDDMLKLTVDVLGLTAFSFDFNSVSAKNSEDAPLFTAFNTILKTFVQRGRGKQLFSWLPTQENELFNAAIKRLDDVVSEIIFERIKEKQSALKTKENKNNESRKYAGGILQMRRETDILDYLLTEDDKGEMMPDKLLADNMKTLLFAGHDTTASALSWALYLISTNHEVESKLLAEFETLDKEVSSEEEEYHLLERLPYLNAVVKEVLRMYPSALFSRTPISKSGERICGKFFVPYGSDVYVVPHLLHRNERYWDEPMVFKPERWLAKDDEKSAERRGIYLPFSLGFRNCVGRMLALAEIRSVLKFLLQRYKFTYTSINEEDKPTDPKVVIIMTACPSPISMKIKKRCI